MMEYIGKLIGRLIEIDEGTIRMVVDALGAADIVFTAGNGGSSSTASHIANDLTKMAGKPTICLTDSVPILTAYSNDDGYEDALVNYYRSFIPVFWSRAPAIIIYSGSGASPNVVNLARAGVEGGANVICITGYPYNPLDNMDGVTSICFNIDDMQMAEDMALVLSHMVVRELCSELHTG